MILKQNGGVVLMHDIRSRSPRRSSTSVLDDLEAENCSGSRTKHDPIWPVSLHYFLRDGKVARAIPDDVTKRTEAYKKALPDRCAKRHRQPALPRLHPRRLPDCTTSPRQAAPERSALTPCVMGSARSRLWSDSDVRCC